MTVTVPRTADSLDAEGDGRLCVMGEADDAPIPPVPADELAQAWARLIPQGDAEHIAAAGVRLVEAYAEPHRHYHSVRHLAEVLGVIDALAPDAHDLDLVRLAAWFHDVVYVPGRADNEDASAELAVAMLADLGVPRGRGAAVARLVRLTASHDPDADDGDGAVLCDADLAVLGADPARYAHYADDIRREYAHVPGEAFAAARADVLRRLVVSNPLFRTPAARSRWEARARANVQSELARLSRVRSDPPSPRR
jgi:predicted metal-dependent HD superfamily phosphohydrolase